MRCRVCLALLVAWTAGIGGGLAGVLARAQDRPAPGAVVINELWYAPESPALEFVELYNRSAEAVEVRRLALADDRRNGSPVRGGPRVLQPGEYLVLVRDRAAFRRRFPGVEAVEVAPWPVLNNGGDVSVLLAGEIEIDAVPYVPSWGGSDSTSLERIDPAGPSDRATNFGSSGAAAGATPGARNAIFARDTDAPQPVFARATLGTERVFSVDFSEPLAAASVEAAGFAVGGEQPASVRVVDEGRRVRLVFEAAPGGQRLLARGVRDLAGNTLGEASIAVAFVAQPFTGRPPGDLVVNEILYDPHADDFDGQPNQPGYIELYNPTERHLALEDYVFTDRPTEEGRANQIEIGRRHASVRPKGFAVAYAAEGASLEEAFPATDFSSENVTLLPVERSTLGLANSGGLVALRRPDGALVDSVFYRPTWHSPAVEDGDGRALERIDPLGPSNAAANWITATAEQGGTPGRPNRAAPPPGQPLADVGIEVVPSPFSPDGDGFDDVAFIRYTLRARVSLVRLRIYDSYGREVYAREAELAGREGQIPWNGRSASGETLRLGVYVALFEALDADGAAVAVFKAPVVLARPLD